MKEKERRKYPPKSKFIDVQLSPFDSVSDFRRYAQRRFVEVEQPKLSSDSELLEKYSNLYSRIINGRVISFKVAQRIGLDPVLLRKMVMNAKVQYRKKISNLEAVFDDAVYPDDLSEPDDRGPLGAY